MRTLKIEQLSKDAFFEFGSYSEMIDPKGVSLGAPPTAFFRDRVVANFDMGSMVAFGVHQLQLRPFLIERTEIHLNTCEVLMPIDGDIIIHAGPAGKEPDFDQFRAFYVPKGTMICLRPGVYHGAAFAAEDKQVHVLIALPELLYRKDCQFVFLNENEKITIEK